MCGLYATAAGMMHIDRHTNDLVSCYAFSFTVSLVDLRHPSHLNHIYNYAYIGPTQCSDCVCDVRDSNVWWRSAIHHSRLANRYLRVANAATISMVSVIWQHTKTSLFSNCSVVRLPRCLSSCALSYGRTCQSRNLQHLTEYLISFSDVTAMCNVWPVYWLFRYAVYKVVQTYISKQVFVI